LIITSNRFGYADFGIEVGKLQARGARGGAKGGIKIGGDVKRERHWTRKTGGF
jgi:hypothetical protein